MGAQADAIARQLTSTVEAAVRMLVLEIDANLRASADAGGTPVDTGHARANWVPSLGAAFTSEVSDGSAHDAGVAAVVAYKLADGLAWIANNAPYINALDLGWSDKAAPGFVENCILRGMQTVEARFTGVDLGSADFARFAAAAAEGDNF